MLEQKHPSKTVRQLRGGQITIPAAFRRSLGIEPDTILQITLDGGELHIRPLHAAQTAAGSDWFQRLYDYFAPVREEAEQRQYGEDELNSTIDDALTAVRRKRA